MRRGQWMRPQLREKILRMIWAGKTDLEIHRKVGVNRAGVWRLRQKLGLLAPVPPHSTPSQQRLLETITAQKKQFWNLAGTTGRA